MNSSLKKPEEFLISAKPSTLLQEAKENCQEEGLIDLDLLRQMQDWSYLSNKVFGAENE